MAKPKPRWIKGGDDLRLLIQPDRLREAIAFYGIALTLHEEPFWSYTKGLLQERPGDFAGAIAMFEATPGSYGTYALPHIDRCREKLAGTYDAEAALDKAFGSLTDQMQSDDSGLLKATLKYLNVLWDTQRTLVLAESPAPRPNFPAGDENRGHTEIREQSGTHSAPGEAGRTSEGKLL